MKKITLFFSFLFMVALGYSQTVRSYTFDNAASVNVSPEQIETSVPSSSFIDVVRIADAANTEETTFAYDANGNSTGALQLSGINDGDPATGRNYLFRIQDFSIDFSSLSDLEVSFDLRTVGALGPNTTLNVDFFVPQTVGVEVVTETDLHVGLSETYQTIVVPLNTADFDNTRTDFFIDIRIGASAVVGDGGTILIDNIEVRAQGSGGPTCSDGIQNGMETGVDCGGPDCPPCTAPGEVNFDAATFGSGVGFMNVFDNPKDGSVGAFQFASGWGIPDLVSIVGASTIELKPNRIGDTNIYWQTENVLEGNKLMEANHFVEDPSLRGTNISFSGNIISNTLGDPGNNLSFDHQAIVFIKVFSSDFSTLFVNESIPIPASGNFTITADATAYNTDEVIQYGFQVLGPNINSNFSNNFDADYNALGSIVIGPPVLSIDDVTTDSKFTIFPNPTKGNWNLSSNNNINTVVVYDILGKQVLSLKPYSNEVVLDASSLRTGIYIAKIEGDNGYKTIKLVKN
jgi:hypothetical protein